MWELIAGVVIVLVALVTGLIINYSAERKAVFEDLKNQVVKQNLEIENLNLEINQLLNTKK